MWQSSGQTCPHARQYFHAYFGNSTLLHHYCDDFEVKRQVQPWWGQRDSTLFHAHTILKMPHWGTCSWDPAKPLLEWRVCTVPIVDEKFSFLHNKGKWVSVRCSIIFWLFLTPWTVACQAPLSIGFSRKNTAVGSHFFLQGIFLAQESNVGLLHYRQILYCLSHQGTFTQPQEALKFHIGKHDGKTREDQEYFVTPTLHHVFPRAQVIRKSLQCAMLSTFIWHFNSIYTNFE